MKDNQNKMKKQPIEDEQPIKDERQPIQMEDN